MNTWDQLDVEIVRKLLEGAVRGCMDSEIGKTIYEETFGDEEPSDEDWRGLLHEDLPRELRDLLEAAGAQDIKIWHRKDDVNLPEYVASATFRGRKVSIDLIAGYDEEVDATMLWAVRVCPGEPDPNILAYYHEV